MGLQYQRVRGNCPITLTVPNDGSVRGYLVTKCVVANHDGTNKQGVTVTHDTVQLFSGYLAGQNGVRIPTDGDSFGGWGDQYSERSGGAFGPLTSVLPKVKDVRQAAGVWLAPGDTFQVAGTNCRASVTYFEEI